MNTVSRTITGGILLIFGIVMTVVGLFIFVTLPYGIAAIVVGLFIFFNKREDEIEKIKKAKHGKGGKK